MPAAKERSRTSPRRDQRVAAAPLHPNQPTRLSTNGQQQHRQRQARERPGRPAEPLPLDQRHEQREQRRRQQRDADQVQPPPAAVPGGVPRQQRDGQRHRDQPDRQRPPGNTQRHPCSSWPPGWSPPTSGPRAADSLITAPSAPNALLRAPYSSWNQGGDGREETRRRRGPARPGGDERPGSRPAARQAREREQARPATYILLVADPVADPAGRDQRQPQREQVSGTMTHFTGWTTRRGRPARWAARR